MKGVFRRMIAQELVRRVHQRHGAHLASFVADGDDSLARFMLQSPVESVSKRTVARLDLAVNYPAVEDFSPRR